MGGRTFFNGKFAFIKGGGCQAHGYQRKVVFVKRALYSSTTKEEGWEGGCFLCNARQKNMKAQAKIDGLGNASIAGCTGVSAA